MKNPPPTPSSDIRNQHALNDGFILENVDRTRTIRHALSGGEGKGMFDDAGLEVGEFD